MILVTGCNPLGTRIVDAMAAEMARGACDQSCPDVPRGYRTYDAMSAESVSRLMEEVKPSVLVMAEEVSDVEYCEKNRMDAMHYNTRAVRFFVDAALKTGSRVVYVSTPYVFDGRKPGGLYTEEDRVNPLNVYGETMLMGEVHSDKAREFLIVRVGELYGSYPGNFASHVYEQIRYGQKVELAKDMYFSPILIEDAVNAIKTLTVNRMNGWYNVAGPQRISHYDFGRKIAAAFGQNPDLIVPVNAVDLGMTVPVPLDTSLNITKLSALVKVHGIDQGLFAMMANMNNM
ncbi:MAG: dTDP-4-dehydrorhamnose reductase [Methanocella sp. PtaU1.Bin125]|nr:MAG: dTDP-4-dehydrorhamnose reductase [Methanocella sp. PtaU1.Bin125]